MILVLFWIPRLWCFWIVRLVVAMQCMVRMIDTMHSMNPENAFLLLIYSGNAWSMRRQLRWKEDLRFSSLPSYSWMNSHNRFTVDLLRPHFQSYYYLMITPKSHRSIHASVPMCHIRMHSTSLNLLCLTTDVTKLPSWLELHSATRI